jgi:hypothetical protein
VLGLVLDTELTYNIVEQVLGGRIDGVSINTQAVAGGRAGSKQSGAVNLFLANNPYATGVKKSDKTPGGPLILGKYRLRTHESEEKYIRLIPFDENNMRGRVGFLIHGRGPRGSDGCIVPTDFSVVELLHSLVAAREKASRPAPTLAVVAVGDLDAIDRRLKWLKEEWSRTA